LTLCNYNIYN